LRKIIYILYFFLLCSGCSVNRKIETRRESVNSNLGKGTIYERIVNQNITSRNFFIERAEFKIINNEEQRSGFVTMKFLMPDKFLISIKSNTGIEIARVFLTGDSIMLNDRMSKKLYIGSASYLKGKYGITTSFLPVLLGDYLNDKSIDSSKINCKDGMVRITGIVEDIVIKYLFDCKYGKCVLTLPDKSQNESQLKINYSEFFNANSINVPGKVEISDSQTRTLIQLRIQKIVFPWKGTLEFVPGKQYEKIYLK
jgi:hypothetical protein